jgi:transcriptional regulator with XRE-family HTH domain
VQAVSNRATSVSEKREAFGAALAEARNVRGVLQSEIADLAGVQQSSVSAWEKGDNQPAPEVVFAIEDYLELKPGHLSRHLGYAPVAHRGVAPTYEQVVMDDPLLDDTQKRAALALYREFTARPAPQARRRTARRR